MRKRTELSPGHAALLAAVEAFEANWTGPRIPAPPHLVAHEHPDTGMLTFHLRGTPEQLDHIRTAMGACWPPAVAGHRIGLDASAELFRRAAAALRNPYLCNWDTAVANALATWLSQTGDRFAAEVFRDSPECPGCGEGCPGHPEALFCNICLEAVESDHYAPCHCYDGALATARALLRSFGLAAEPDPLPIPAETWAAAVSADPQVYVPAPARCSTCGSDNVAVSGDMQACDACGTTGPAPARGRT